MASSGGSSGGSGRGLPVRLQLLVDVVLVLLFFSLDARDLVYKTAWLGPTDSYAFTATTPTLTLEQRPLVVAANPAAQLKSPDAEWSVQSLPSRPPAPRSGWTSFLQKCKSLHAFSPATDDSTAPSSSTTTSPRAFSHVLAKHCHVGRRGAKHVVPELVLSSSVRVDSVAWAACKTLFHHRKPPVCHSPIVRLFGHRYNMDDKSSLVAVDRRSGAVRVNATADDAPGAAYPALPGSDAEMEIIELLTVISKSSPLGSAVCVEGFALTDGAGFYTSTFFGCGSPTYNHSAFVGHLATGFQYFHQDKTWLTSDMLHVSGMTYMVRENRRSIFRVQGLAGADGSWSLEHRTLLNFSCFGALYTVATLIDVLLLVVHVNSALEIVKLMLWPLWTSLGTTASVVSSRSNVKAAFAAEDCQAVLTASLYRSKPIVALIVVADLLHWMMVVPNSIVLSEPGVGHGAKLHAALSTFRFWVLVLLALHSLWDAYVAWFERRAFAFVHGTYITIAEVAAIAGIVGFLRRSTILALPHAKHAADAQRLTDAASFAGRVALSHAFPEHHDSLQNTDAAVVALMYGPLVSAIAWSLVAIACFVGVRYAYGQLWHPDAHRQHDHPRFLLRRRTSNNSSVKPDLSETNRDGPAAPSPREGAMPPAPPSPTGASTRWLGSPNRTVASSSPGSDGAAADGAAVLPASGHEYALRLPLEKVVDVPIRARSLVRNSWKMEKKVGHQVFLRPPQYLEHGIILQGGCLTTRFGFTDIVHPYLRARDHVLPDEDDDLSAHRTSTSGAASPRRRSASADKLQRDAHTLRLPLVPLR